MANVKQKENIHMRKLKTKEVLEKMRQSMIKNGRYKKVISDSDNMTFESVVSAARFYDLDPSTVDARCKKQIKGFRFA